MRPGESDTQRKFSRRVECVYSVPDRQSRPHRAVRPSPVFLAFLAAGVLGGVLSWSDANSTGLARFGVFLLIVGGWVVSLSLHEFAHAYAAYRAGDTSVEGAGYLTLNPVRYAHPVLSIVLPLIFIALGGMGCPAGRCICTRTRSAPGFSAVWRRRSAR